MTPLQITDWIVNTFDHVAPKNSWGETSFFVNPENRLPSGAYFATLKEKNGDNDKASDLDRKEVYRLNFGPGRAVFEDLFGKPPPRPAKGEIIEGNWNFTAVDTIMPHPVYGWMSWLCVVNPGVKTFETCKPLIAHAHAKALVSVQKRLEKGA